MHGSLAVLLFWVISGWVMSHNYNEDHTINFKQYTFKRFARLYPLHFLTLNLTLLLHLIGRYFDKYSISTNDSLSTYAKNLFFLNNNLMGSKPSFNSPIWSIAIEFVCYIIFYKLIRKIKGKGYLLVVLIPLEYILYRNHFPNNRLLLGFLYFNLGMLIYFFYVKSSKKVFFLLHATLYPIVTYISRDTSYYEDIKFYKVAYIAINLIFISVYFDNFLRNDKLKKIFLKLGSLTYSIYLLHIPLSKVIILLEINKYADQLWFFILYFAVILALANLMYRFVEIPAKKYLLKIYK